MDYSFFSFFSKFDFHLEQDKRNM